MTAPVLPLTALTVVTSHKLAGTSLAVFLQDALGRSVTWRPPAGTVTSPAAVLNGVHEEESSLPRLMNELMARQVRTLLIYDDAKPSDELRGAAHDLGIHLHFGVRGDPYTLVDQVRHLLAGRTWAQDRSREEWVRTLESTKERLTNREQVVVDAYYSTPETTIEEVAGQLGISVNTVRVHLANVRRKLAGRHVGNRQALHAALVDKGWID